MLPFWGSKGNRWVSQLQYIDLSPSPFTGYACVTVSINYRLTHRTTDATGPHVSNTNVSLHKSITRNILRNIKGKRGKGRKGEVGRGQWLKKYLVKNYFILILHTHTHNKSIDGHGWPWAPARANVLHVPLCPLRRGICSGSASGSATGDSLLLSCAGLIV